MHLFIDISLFIGTVTIITKKIKLKIEYPFGKKKEELGNTRVADLGIFPGRN